MPHPVKSAFRNETLNLQIDQLQPSHPLDARERKHAKYKQIAASIRVIGLIEPLVVFPASRGKFLVLDGHKRLDILVAQGVTEVDCLIATDDEAYTYNRRVNYLSSVGEHRMILKALEQNSEEEVAEALNVDISTIRKKRDLLDGVCKEAVDLLHDRRVPPETFAVLRKMKPIRQIEAARVMIASNLHSGRFARVLLAGTRDDLLTEVPKAGRVSPSEKEAMEAETDSLVENIDAVESSYGAEVLRLTIACRYLEKLLATPSVRTYLDQHHHDALVEIDAVLSETKQEILSPQVG